MKNGNTAENLMPGRTYSVPGPARIKILMLEDSADDADLIERFLLKGGMNIQMQRAEDKKGFEKALKQFQPDVILSDHTLPQFNSMEALKIVQVKLKHVPFILVTGTVSEEFAVMCLKAGAHDYILKNNLKRLPAAIEASLRSHSLQRENSVIKKLNSEIEKKNKELDLLNSEKDRFLSIVSHDLYHYLSSMTLTVQQLKSAVDGAPSGSIEGMQRKANINEPGAAYMRKDSAKAKKASTAEISPRHELPGYISGLERYLTNMRILLSDILTVNRIQNGIIEPVYNLVNICELLNEAVKRNEDAAIRKNITILCNNLCNEHFIKTDAGYFSIIVDNLLSNAIKFSYPGKRVWINLTRMTNYIFEVKDEGQGIAPSEAPYLYRRFHKLSAKPTQNEPTNGLGLSIVKELVDKLNWKIECESRSGEGATFRVTIQ